MTTEEKAKAYDNALSVAKRIYQFSSDIAEIKRMEQIFPELVESEDEKNIKDLIDELKCSLRAANCQNEACGGGHEKRIAILEWAIAWLEKQGKEKYLSEPIKDYQGSFACWNNAHDFRPKHLQRCICYDKYMKGIYCYVYDDISKYWCTQTTEEHDPDGDNHISDYADYRVPVWMPLPDILFYSLKSWLEKQGDKDKFIEKELGCIKNYRENAIKRLEELEKQCEKEEVDGFDAELNALLKKYEYLPKEELAECLEFYLGVVKNIKI